MFFGPASPAEEKNSKKTLFINYLKLKPALSAPILASSPTEHKAVENTQNNSLRHTRQ
jgi:hypothetical protein